MMATLVGWWIYELTNQPFAIGLIGLSEVISAVSLALYAGHVIDQSEKRKMMLTGILLYFVSASTLLFLATPFTIRHLNKHAIAMAVYFVIFCTGIIRAFTGPIFGVIISAMVPRSLLQNAITWSQGTWLTASVVGHATGGFLIAWVGNAGVLVTISILIFSSFMAMTRLKPKPPVSVPGEKKTWESVKEGLRFVARTRDLLGALSLDLFAVLFGGADRPRVE